MQSGCWPRLTFRFSWARQGMRPSDRRQGTSFLRRPRSLETTGSDSLSSPGTMRRRLGCAFWMWRGQLFAVD